MSTLIISFHSLSSQDWVMAPDIQKKILFSVVTKKRDIIVNRCEMVEWCSIEGGVEKCIKCKTRSLKKGDKLGVTCIHIHTGTKLTILLNPWYRVLLEKLTGLQQVKKFPPFYGTRRFITTLTGLRQPSLSWASSIQSIHPYPTSWRSILILSTNLRLGLPSGLQNWQYILKK